MSYADLFVAILIIILLIIASVHILKPKPEADRRTVWTDERGNVVAIGERRGTSPGELSGRGTYTSPALQLSPGTYRIDYQFEALTRLALLDSTGEETLFIKSGSGAESLTIAGAGRCRLLIEPTDEGAAWRIAYRPIAARVVEPPELGTL